MRVTWLTRDNIGGSVGVPQMCAEAYLVTLFYSYTFEYLRMHTDRRHSDHPAVPTVLQGALENLPQLPELFDEGIEYDRFVAYLSLCVE